MAKRCPRPFDGVPRPLIKLIEVLTILFHNYFAGYFDYWTLNRGGPLSELLSERWRVRNLNRLPTGV